MLSRAIEARDPYTRGHSARVTGDLPWVTASGATGIEKAASRAMLRAVGMTDNDWDKPQIGVASAWNEVTPCNLTLRKLAERAKEGVREAGGFPLEFGTITVSDGISMGHEGMRASLVSREVITDSVECVMHAERFDGFVGLAGCDKSIPAMLMAAARLDLPSVFVYNGSILPGEHNGVALDITSVFEAVGACAAGTLTENGLGEIEMQACPTEGSCAGMFTANTMASIGEALGMSLPGSASPPAIDPRREDDARRAGAAVVEMLRLGITPRMLLSHPANPTKPSSRSACMTHSTESVMTSRLTSDARMPSWPMLMPSLTVMVPNSIGNPPAERTPSLANSASLRSVMLHGVTSFHALAMAICGFTQSASVMPTARSMARAGALVMPSVTSRLRGLMSTGVPGS
jgi:hypothetical protein